jgi:hypothetical protein
LNSRVLILPVLAVAALADTSDPAPDAILQHYSAALQNEARTGQRMEVSIYASLPNLKKTGRLHALRRISSLGRITYQVLGFEGDNTVKREVIARYLTAEANAARSAQADGLRVTPDRYSFQYRGAAQRDGRQTFLFQVGPKDQRSLLARTGDFFRRLVGRAPATSDAAMFKGQIWIDRDTYLPVEQAGTLAGVSSIWIKRIDFTLKYVIRDGRSVPVRLESVADTRVVGRAELTIDYTNVTVDEDDLELDQ